MNIKECVKQNTPLTFLYGGSITKAQHMLSKNETLIYAVVCNISAVHVAGRLNNDSNFSIKNKVNGVFVITTKRIYFCNNFAGKGITKQILLNNIQSIDDTTSLMGFGKLRIAGITEAFVIDVNAKISNEIVNNLNNVMVNI